MTHNHAYSLGFAVSGSDYEDPDECLKNEKMKVIQALLNRVDELMHNDAEYHEALEPFDSYEEGN